MDNENILESVLGKLIEALALAHKQIGRLETDRGNLHARIEKLMRDNHMLMARLPPMQPAPIREVS